MFNNALFTILGLAALANTLPIHKQTLSWEKCPDDLNAPEDTTLQCAYHHVPLDWDGAEKGEITIGIAKLPASDPKRRIGNLFINPGGPGGSSTQSVTKFAQDPEILPREIRARFDIIGEDVRGVGLSTNLDCERVPTFDMMMGSTQPTRPPAYPTDQESYKQLIDANAASRQACLDKSGPLVDYMDTRSVARDYEAVRKALGDEPMTYIGYSYGTQLGQEYAELFPASIRAMVLDGVASRTTNSTSNLVVRANGADAALKHFFDWCSTQGEGTCSFAKAAPSQSLEKTWTDIMERAQKEPIPCASDQCVFPELSADKIRGLSFHKLFDPEVGYPELGRALYETYNGNAAFLSNKPAAQEKTTKTNTNAVHDAVACADWGHEDSSAADFRERDIIAKTVAPLMEGLPSSDYAYICAGWPSKNRNTPHKIQIPESSQRPRILLVNAVYDPATPHAGAAMGREEIGPGRASLITRDGAGHGTWLKSQYAQGETYAAVTKYVLDLEVPQDGVMFES